ncbi:hypothetical protein V6N00_14835 [Tersicoccus sp. MR15.9]|uniref:hypothetical protein n=1 Tax=Tersicoccus mangrovi TaxID=3121635 RepID=UPI002FE62C3E
MADRRPATRPAGKQSGTQTGQRPTRNLRGASAGGPAPPASMPWWTTTLIVLDLIWLVFTLLGTTITYALASFVDQTFSWYLLMVLVLAAYAAFVAVPVSAVLAVLLIRQRRWPWLLVPALVIGAVIVGFLAAT